MSLSLCQILSASGLRRRVVPEDLIVNALRRSARSASRCFAEPGDGTLQSIAQGSIRAPVEFGERTRCVQAAARLTVRLWWVPAHSAVVPNKRANDLEEFTNADFFS